MCACPLIRDIHRWLRSMRSVRCVMLWRGARSTYDDGSRCSFPPYSVTTSDLCLAFVYVSDAMRRGLNVTVVTSLRRRVVRCVYIRAIIWCIERSSSRQQQLCTAQFYTRSRRWYNGYYDANVGGGGGGRGKGEFILQGVRIPQILVFMFSVREPLYRLSLSLIPFAAPFVCKYVFCIKIHVHIL